MRFFALCFAAAPLTAQPGLNRRMIGEYLGNVISSFNMAVLEAYVEQFELANMTFDHALRFFIASFRLPGEAQKIERILQTFARKYHGSNPGLFQHEDTPFVLAFSVVMLNTDAHNVVCQTTVWEFLFCSLRLCWTSII